MVGNSAPVRYWDVFTTRWRALLSWMEKVLYQAVMQPVRTLSMVQW
jgi:hypothetical protein